MKNTVLVTTFLTLLLWTVGCTEGAGVTGDGCPPTAPCGDGLVDTMAGEVCDPGNSSTGAPMNLGNESCSSLGMSGDGLRCNCRCQLDMDACIHGSGDGMGGSIGGP